jgi:hypothetical protein
MLNQLVNKELKISNSALLHSIGSLKSQALLFNNIEGLKSFSALSYGIDNLKSYKASFNSLDKMKPIFGMSQAIYEKIDVYNQQLRLSEQMAHTLSGIFSVKQSALNLINANNFSNVEKLNSFDIFSASIFLKEYKNYHNDNELNQSISEVQSILSENSNLKDEIIKLQNTMIVLQHSNRKEIHSDTWCSIGGYESLFEWFYQKKLIKDFGLSPIKAKIVMFSIVILTLVYKYAEEIIIEAKGADLFNDFINYYNNNEYGRAGEIGKHITLPSEISDFTIKSAPIYLRNSSKSKQIAIFAKITNVKILKIKNAWSFVEGEAIVFKENSNRNRKKYRTNNQIVLTKKLKGWVKNDNLDMFQ